MTAPLIATKPVLLKTIVLVACCLTTSFCFAQSATAPVAEQDTPAVGASTAESRPRKLSEAEIQRLTLDGDRLVDQGDYKAAVRAYTQAYMSVVANVRGQAFLKDVEPSVFSREELGEEMLRLMEEEYSAEELLLLDSSYKALGLVPADVDTQALMAQLLTEEVAGFYNPDSKQMVLIVDEGSQAEPGWFGRLLGAKPAFDKDEQKTTLAHELTHALQDQLYDLNAMEAGIEQDDDMLLAFSALVEGDATLLMFVEAGGEDVESMDPAAMRATFNLMSWMMPMAGGEAYRRAPAVFRESLIFPYFQGMLFTLGVASDGGWKAVHAAYDAPPLSTEQILHPRKYLDQAQLDVPQIVKLPALADSLPDDWTALGGNCLGELQTQIMLKRVPGGSAASEGWDGDRYEIFRREDGTLAYVYVSIWDSVEDAEQFAQAFEKYRAKELRMQNSSAQDSLASDSVLKIVLEAEQVKIVEGFDANTTDALLERLGGCEFEDKVFPAKQP